MRVAFDLTLYNWHIDYYTEIIEELSNRGHLVEIVQTLNKTDLDFLITADEGSKLEAYNKIWIGHSFDVKGAVWGDEERMKILDGFDHCFVYSKAYSDYLKKYVNTQVHVTGMPKLDSLFKNRTPKNLLYAHTFNPEFNSVGIVDLEPFKNLLTVEERGHPAFNVHFSNIKESLRNARIVVSDYSSVLVEAVTLNIPTVFIDKAGTNIGNPVARKVLNAVDIVNNRFKLEEVVLGLLANKDTKEEQRLIASNQLLDFKGTAAKEMVDIMEGI